MGRIEVVRRIYLVFQDRNWTSRPWDILEEDIQATPDSFRIHVTARGTFDASEFTWNGRLTGTSDGAITYAVEGSTSAPFLRNRLGLCVLHPMTETSGRPVTLEHVDGGIVDTSFPSAIEPNQPFLNVRALTHTVRPGLTATVRFSGEVFETEDHRNWSDASFKHYCTPIALPFPVEVQPGDVLRQSVDVTLAGEVPTPDEVPEQPQDEAIHVTLTDTVVPLPRIGIQLDHDGHRLTAQETDRLRRLRLPHVRIDLSSEDSASRLDAALDDAGAIGAALVPALTVHGSIDHLAPYADHPGISHWLVFDADAKVTSPDLVAQCRRVLGERVGGGTNLYFTELNRNRPQGPERIAFSLNPQVHASDDQSLLQNAVTPGVIARNARRLYPDALLEVSPITLRPRFNPNATAPELDLSSTPLPSRVDARQCMPIAAAWLVVALKGIAESGCLDAITCFEATGWEGLMEREDGSPQPQDFASTPGETYPVYDVLAAVAGATTARVAESSPAGLVEALVVDDVVLLANVTESTRVVGIGDRSLTCAPRSVTVVERTT